MPKGKQKHEETIPSEVGEITGDLELPTTSEVVFKHIWRIKNYKKMMSKRDALDSPVFRCAVNGFASSWNISVRFWKSANGKRVKNPIVVCLNLTECETEESGQGKVRFQFGVWDTATKHWECCAVSRVALNFQTMKDLWSIGYRDLSIFNHHIDPDGHVNIMVKLQLIQTEKERHCLSQDLGRVLNHPENTDFTDTEIESSSEKFRVHSFIIRARSPVLAQMLVPADNVEDKSHVKYRLNLTELPDELVNELVRYLYTDKVENSETNSSRLLPIAKEYSLPGLSDLCERALLESLAPANILEILSLANRYRCDMLRKAVLNYCEHHTEMEEFIVPASQLAWRVGETVYPELLLEAYESLGSSSSNIDSCGSHSDDQT